MLVGEGAGAGAAVSWQPVNRPERLKAKKMTDLGFMVILLIEIQWRVGGRGHPARESLLLSGAETGSTAHRCKNTRI
jgi:hypothetical protein